MSRRESDREYRLTQGIITAVYVLLVSALTIASAAAADELRASTSTHYAEGGRDAPQQTGETVDEYAALATEGERRPPGSGDEVSDGQPPTARASSGEFWIYDADPVLFGDDDRDGFFYGIDLLMDADTVWSSAWVYAVVYLSLDGGPWNEYASTDDFEINGQSADDEYVLVTELRSGYPTGDYDLLIELFDADTGEFLADFGPGDSSALSYLPLEDFNRDAPRFDRPVTVRHGHGGGSAGPLPLVLLALAGLLRLSKRRAA